MTIEPDVVGRNHIAGATIDIQIVSHGHADCLPQLLDDIEHGRYRILVAENVPHFSLDLPERNDLRHFRNDRVLGFAENHNRLAAIGGSEFITILNPDLRLPRDVFDTLMRQFDDPAVGVVAPRVYSPQGGVEDNARFVVTLAQVLRRALVRSAIELDYPDVTRVCQPDWVAGMFMIIRRSVFERIGGFDPGFRLYCEDVDFCIRTWLAGYKVVCVPCVGVIHAARRASRYNATHFRWHVASLARLWRSTAWRDFRRIRGAQRVA